MRTLNRSLLTALVLLVTLAAVPARAAGLRVLASDAKGVTLRLDVGAWSLSDPGPDGRTKIIGVPDAYSLADPGHALLPAWSTMLAVPLDGRPTARVLARAGDEAREDVRLAIALKPGFVKPPGATDYEPIAEVVEPLTDGPWPLEPVRLGTPTSFRGRRLVGIEVRPFRYDEATARLTATTSLTVRVDFNRPAGATVSAGAAYEADPHADATLASSVLNFEQARTWRAAPASDPVLAPSIAAARAAAARAAGAEANAFDESDPEVRVRLDSTGVYALPFEELVAKGYPTGVPVAQVSVHRHEFDEGATVPYQTVDVPVEVDDTNQNNVFDAGDQIWLFSRTWAARSGASQWQRWWGDAEVVFVTRRTSGGARVPHRSGWRGQSGLTPLASYPYFRHWEKNLTRMMPLVTLPGDTTLDLFHWTDFTQYDVQADTITFAVSAIDTTHTVNVQVGWMGRASNTHYMWGAVKNPLGQQTTVADGDFWIGKRPYLSSATLRGSALGEGTNRFVDWGRTDPSVITCNAGLNWFETTYWRRFRAVQDAISFNSAGAEGEIQIHADAFSSDSIHVYDVTVPESPVRLVLDPAHVSGGAFDLQDFVATGTRREYAAASEGDPPTAGYGPMVPPSSAFSFVHRNPLDALTSIDYLMVVGDSSWLPAVKPLADLRASQNLPVLVVTSQELYDQFNGGRHSAAALQRFAKYAYTRWSSRFLLMVGDGTLDPMSYSIATKDWVPVIPIPGPVSVPDGFEITVSDNAYGCITGNCDPIFGGGDVIPELMIGRLPANSLADVQNMVAKIVDYESLAGDQSWRSHAILLADDAYSSDAGFGVGGGVLTYCWKSWEEYFVGLNKKVRSVMVDEGGLSHMDVERFNLRYYITTGYRANNSYGDTCRTDRTATQTLVHNSVTPVLFSHLNSGTLWWNFQGHANEYVLTHENLYANNGDVAGSDDKWLFHNDGKPILWTAFSCHANMFARAEGSPGSMFGGCLGEDMLTLARGGAVASWASSCYEIVPRDDSTHLNVALARAMFSVPPSDPQVSGSRVVLGEAIQAAFVRYLPTVVGNGSERGTSLTYTLLGDPAQRISIGRPQTVVRANDTLVVDQVAVKLHSPLDTLTLVADLISTVRIDSVRLYRRLGGVETRIALDSAAFVPPYPDTASGGVSGGRRYRVTYRDHLVPRTHAYVYRTTDHDGLENTFTVQFELASVLHQNGVPLSNGAPVMPNADLSIDVASPAPLSAPTSDIAFTLNGVAQTFTAQPTPGDASGREWTLHWTHPNYPPGRYDVALVVAGGDTLRHAFTVTNKMAFRDLIAFPNPFDNDGTHFSFNLVSPDPADVHISVFTISGRKIWAGEWLATAPGYHQFPWDGRDADGDQIANGTYLINATAVTASGQRTQQYGRLVKLRKPRHVDVPEPGATTP